MARIFPDPVYPITARSAASHLKGHGIAAFLLFPALLVSMLMIAEVRHALSVLHYSRDFKKFFQYFARGVECYPHNGYNYFSMRELFRDRGRPEAAVFLKEFMEYFSSSVICLYLARGSMNHGRMEEAARWYRYLLFVRPDIRGARDEYRKIIDGDDKG